MSAIDRIGIVVFDGIERLDIEGPAGVLGWTQRITGTPKRLQYLSKDGREVSDHLLHKAVVVDGSTKGDAKYDVLIVPGGDIRLFLNDHELVDDIRRLGSSCRILASVCTGAFLVAKAGLADGKTVATHWQFHDEFKRTFSQVALAEDARVFKDGKLWSSAGISAGIDMSLRLVISEWGADVAKRVQELLEYFPEPPFPRDDVTPR